MILVRQKTLLKKIYLKKKKKNPYYHPTFCVIGSKEFYAREQDLG
jgi:hypothetical protein